MGATGKGSAAVDAAFRLVYRLGFPVADLWWRVRRPRVRSVFVAAWCGDALLLVRNSYKAGETLPGGGLGRDEAPAAGAARELFEEAGLRAEPDELVPVLEAHLVHRGRRDHVHVFELAVAPERARGLRIDRREVIAAEWVPREALRGRPLIPHGVAYLDFLDRRSGGDGPEATRIPGSIPHDPGL